MSLESLILVLLIFGYLVAGASLLGLVCWVVIAIVPDMRGEQPEAFEGLGRLVRHGMGIGLLSMALAFCARSLLPP